MDFFRQCAIDMANGSSPAQRIALKDYGERAEAKLQQLIDIQDGRKEPGGDQEFTAQGDHQEGN